MTEEQKNDLQDPAEPKEVDTAVETSDQPYDEGELAAKVKLTDEEGDDPQDEADLEK